MILFTQNTINKIALSLGDVLSSATPYYLFELKNTTQVPYYFTSEDVSVCPSRASVFEITVSGSGENISASTITLDNGYYDYKIYGVDNLSDTQLSAATTSVLNLGMAYVSGTTTQEYWSQNNNNGEQTIKYYK